MRRAFFFIVAVCLATPSFASIPRASALDLSSPSFDRLPETRIRVSEVLAPFERPAPSLLSRALRQAYEHASTTSASGLAGFLSVDPGKDWDMSKPQSWNMYSYVRNNPINNTDPTGKWLDTLVDVVDLGVGVADMWRSALRGEAVSARQNLAVGASVIGMILPGATGLGSAVRHADDVADGAKALNGARKADFVVTESGTAIPVSQSRMKQGFDAAGFPNKPTRAPGTEYTLPDQSKVRTMEPSGNAPRRASFENRNGNPVDPNTGKPPQPPRGLTPAERKQWVRDRTHVEQKP